MTSYLHSLPLVFSVPPTNINTPHSLQLYQHIQNISIRPFRPTNSLGARQRLPAGPGPTLANTSDTFGRLRPRSHSPNILYQTHGREGKVQQQSRSLDERRSRISRQRNSSFSTLHSEESQQPVYSAPPPPPPTITLRRPSMTCLQPGHITGSCQNTVPS